MRPLSFRSATALESFNMHDCFEPTHDDAQKTPLEHERKAPRAYFVKGESRLLLLSLNGGDGDDANDVIGGATARQIIHRGAESLQNGAVRFSLGKTLN